MTEADLTAIWLTMKLATATTLLLIAGGTPIAWWLARTSSKIRILVEPVVALPLVLPPTVMGFYLLIFFAPNGWLGHTWLMITGSPLAFTFSALVLGSFFYSLPFYVQPLQVAMESLEETQLEAAATLGSGPIDRFFSVVFPLCKRGFVTATCLAFAHTVGEFGIVLMIGGNIPGETRVVSIAIYDHVESLQYANAHILATAMLLFCFLLLLIIYTTNRRFNYRLVQAG